MTALYPLKEGHVARKSKGANTLWKAMHFLIGSNWQLRITCIYNQLCGMAAGQRKVEL
jgi:hypothetical protein